MSAHNNSAVQEELVIVLISVVLLENVTLCSPIEADSNLKGAEIQTVLSCTCPVHRGHGPRHT